MKLPFTVDQFFDVFARYNQQVWPMQIVLVLLAFICLILLFRAGIFAGRVIAAVLAFYQIWIAVAYHFILFSRINPAAWLFGLLSIAGAAAFAWFGVAKSRLGFRFKRGWPGIAGTGLILYALAVYPWIGTLIGHHYPATPTFGLPCPTTIFTLGMLVLAEAPAPRIVFLIPIIWPAIGSLAAFQLGVLQDLGLLAAGIAGIITMIRAGARQGGLKTSTV
jgi:hypothetical protein